MVASTSFFCFFCDCQVLLSLHLCATRGYVRGVRHRGMMCVGRSLILLFWPSQVCFLVCYVRPVHRIGPHKCALWCAAWSVHPSRVLGFFFFVSFLSPGVCFFIFSCVCSLIVLLVLLLLCGPSLSICFWGNITVFSYYYCMRSRYDLAMIFIESRAQFTPKQLSPWNVTSKYYLPRRSCFMNITNLVILHTQGTRNRSPHSHPFTPLKSFSVSMIRRPVLPFPLKVSEVEKKVADLIIANQISARIDSTNATLHAKHTEQRSISCQKVGRAVSCGCVCVWACVRVCACVCVFVYTCVRVCCAAFGVLLSLTFGLVVLSHFFLQHESAFVWFGPSPAQNKLYHVEQQRRSDAYVRRPRWYKGAGGAGGGGGG